MGRVHGWLFLLVALAICAGGVWMVLQLTAAYPTLGEPVSYPVNQVDGFELTINESVFSPFKGYTIRWAVTANTDEVYKFAMERDIAPDFSFLERCVDGQWYRLGYREDEFGFNSVEFLIGGEEGAGLEGSMVQKYDYYGTRLEPGLYRVTLKMSAKDGTPHYLAAEFAVG